MSTCNWLDLGNTRILTDYGQKTPWTLEQKIDGACPKMIILQVIRQENNSAWSFTKYSKAVTQNTKTSFQMRGPEVLTIYDMATYLGDFVTET